MMSEGGGGRIEAGGAKGSLSAKDPMERGNPV